jgi:hypothetical protein
MARALRASGGRRVIRLALVALGAIVVLLVIAQLVLPKIAADRISSRIGRYGQVTSVHVSAWPAVELLFKHADSVTVRAARLTLDPAQTDDLLDEARDSGQLSLSVARAREGPLAVSDVHLRKRGRALHASAFASAADVNAALPPGFDVQLLSSAGGKVAVRASGGLFGVGASVDAVAEARDGKLVVRPRSPLLAAFALTLFAESHVRIEALAARAATGPEGAPGYVLEASATLR